jgi:hypothetical protein
MPKKSVSTFSSEQQQLTRIFAVLVVVLIAVGIGLWWTKVYESPKNVFWGMIGGSLGTPGVSLQVQVSEGGTSLNEAVRVGFGARKIAQAFTTYHQSSTVIKYQIIGVPAANYNRYLAITSTKPAAKAKSSLANVLGVWATTPPLTKSQTADSLDNYLYGQSTLGVIPFANISEGARHKLVVQAQKTDAYSVNWSQVKHARVDGHSGAYVYSVSIAPQAYASFMQAVARAAGLGSPSQFSPKNYSAKSADIKVQISVNPLTRALLFVNYGQNRTEKVTNYGEQPQVSVPLKTITAAQLQQRLVAAQ